MATFGETARNKLRWLLGTNVGSDIDLGFQTLAEDVDTKMASYEQGAVGSRPAAGRPNALYYGTDNHVLYHDSGTEWEPVGSLVKSNTLAPNGGEMVQVTTGTVVLPDPATKLNRRIGVAHTGASGEITVSCPTSEMWTIGKTLKLRPGEVIIFRADGVTWITDSWRKTLGTATARKATPFGTKGPVLDGVFTADQAAGREFEVMADFALGAAGGNPVSAALSVGGVVRQEVYCPPQIEGTIFNGKAIRFGMTFSLPPGVSWTIVKSGLGVMEDLHVSYAMK